MNKCSLSESIRASKADHECRGDPLAVEGGVRFAAKISARGGSFPIGAERNPGLRCADTPGSGSPPYQTFPEVTHDPPCTEQ